jgi:hypothetical protein
VTRRRPAITAAPPRVGDVVTVESVPVPGVRRPGQRGRVTSVPATGTVVRLDARGVHVRLHHLDPADPAAVCHATYAEVTVTAATTEGTP